MHEPAQRNHGKTHTMHMYTTTTGSLAAAIGIGGKMLDRQRAASKAISIGFPVDSGWTLSATGPIGPGILHIDGGLFVARE